MVIGLSVITRTADRLAFLARVRDGLCLAAVPNSEWIICDDAPEGTAGITQFVDRAREQLHIPIRLVNTASASRPHAANRGIEEAEGSLIHLHDDDDTVAPAFYRRAIDFLETQPHYGGVATFSDRVDERLENGQPILIKRRPHYHDVRAVTLTSMATVQTIPPIAFVARRSVMDKVGRFNEELLVCEDHEYFLRFLLVADIGIVPEVLAAFHQRPGSNSGAAANSSASTAHVLEDARFRNAMLRSDIAAGRVGLGWLLALGEMNRTGWRANLVIDTLRRRTGFRILERLVRR